MRNALFGILLGLCCTGCAPMAGFFIGLGILIQCGPMPMSPSDCESRPAPPPAQLPPPPLAPAAVMEE